MAEVGRDLWESSGPTPLPKQSHLGFEYLQRRRLPSLSGQPVPVLWNNICNASVPCGELLPDTNSFSLAAISTKTPYLTAKSLF